MKDEARRSVQTPSRSYAQSSVRPIKHECRKRIVPVGERYVRDAVDAYVVDYNRERPCPGMDNELLAPRPAPIADEGTAACDEQRGGLSSSYCRAT